MERCFYHRCKRRLNHFLYQGLCDLEFCGQIQLGDIIYLTIIPTNQLWAKAIAIGAPFLLDYRDVRDSQFEYAIQLFPGKIFWCADADNDVWQEYPPVDNSPYASWESWKCGYETCTCKNSYYEESPNAPGARVGNRVFLSTIKSPEPVIYTLTAKKNDLPKGILSVASPLGGAVHWKKEGDVVQAGPNHIEYLIEKIE